MSYPPPTPYLALSRRVRIITVAQDNMIFGSLPRASYATSDPYELHLVHMTFAPPLGPYFLRISLTIPPSSPLVG